jgi:CDP-paratose 2-epimerase
MKRPVLITGGAGFIGTNLAARFLRDGERVLIYDSLCRPGVENNLEWLTDEFGSDVEVQIADVRNAHAIRRAVAQASRVFHFAAQVAVTTSLANPVIDFEVNVRGTLNVLEAIRRMPSPPPLLFTSTNKVYGGLEDLSLRSTQTRYEPLDRQVRRFGVGEDRPLDFKSPYGCSKGAADQYVLDYGTSFHLPVVVFRMSCIYGPHQFGTEDQGWVAHFLIQAMEKEPLTIYGDGKQVRDVLYVDDLIDAMVLAIDRLEATGGRAFNLGGSPRNTTSLVELVEMIEQIEGSRPQIVMDGWRTGDQRYYVSDTRSFRAATGWSARVGVREGVERLYDWLQESRTLTHAPVKSVAHAAVKEVLG